MIKPPSEILEALFQGQVSTWNAWREKQKGVVDLQWADLTGGDLQGADLTGANLTGAYLEGANLTGANLTGAYLQDANLTGANLTEANLRLANLQGADLQDAYLPYSNLEGANLLRANLTGANLQWANLEGTGIAYSSLRFRCIITPDHAWLGCKGGSHYYWESLSREDALVLDDNAHFIWEHRDDLLEMMQQCREHGWPKGDSDDKTTT